MAVYTVLTVFILTQTQPVEAKSYSDETYERQSLKALAPSSPGSKSYRKKGSGDVKPTSASSGEHGGRRFRGEEQMVHRQQPSSDVLVKEDMKDQMQAAEPLFGESVSQEKMPYISSDFEKWEIRPVEKDENALTQSEIEMIKAHYEDEKNKEVKLPLFTK